MKCSKCGTKMIYKTKTRTVAEYAIWANTVLPRTEYDNYYECPKCGYRSD